MLVASRTALPSSPTTEDNAASTAVPGTATPPPRRRRRRLHAPAASPGARHVPTIRPAHRRCCLVRSRRLHDLLLTGVMWPPDGPVPAIPCTQSPLTCSMWRSISAIAPSTFPARTRSTSSSCSRAEVCSRPSSTSSWRPYSRVRARRLSKRQPGADSRPERVAPGETVGRSRRTSTSRRRCVMSSSSRSDSSVTRSPLLRTASTSPSPARSSIASRTGVAETPNCSAKLGAQALLRVEHRQVQGSERAVICRAVARRRHWATLWAWDQDRRYRRVPQLAQRPGAACGSRRPARSGERSLSLSR